MVPNPWDLQSPKDRLNSQPPKNRMDDLVLGLQKKTISSILDRKKERPEAYSVAAAYIEVIEEINEKFNSKYETNRCLLRNYFENSITSMEAAPTEPLKY